MYLLKPDKHKPRLPIFWVSINRLLVDRWPVDPSVEDIVPDKPKIRPKIDRNSAHMMNRSCFNCDPCSVFSGIPNKLPASCLSATTRFTKRFMQTMRWAGIYGSPCAARRKTQTLRCWPRSTGQISDRRSISP